MKKKILLFSLLALAIFAALGTQAALAHGWFGGANVDPVTLAERQQAAFEREAAVLGITVDQIKEYWSQGKNMWEIAQELGLSQEQLQTKITEQRQAVWKANLQALVDRGVITPAQADARLKFMTTNSNQKRFGPKMGGGMGHFFKGMGL